MHNLKSNLWDWMREVHNLYILHLENLDLTFRSVSQAESFQILYDSKKALNKQSRERNDKVSVFRDIEDSFLVLAESEKEPEVE